MKIAIVIGFILSSLIAPTLYASGLLVQDGRAIDKVSVADDEDFVFESGQPDDPSLPRYLCIGDSISSNYSQAIIDIHAGKINAHHPPANCRSSNNGRQNIESWLGDYTKPGNQWDVISFNFGHWDDSETKTNYQANLRAIIEKLKQTKAKLIWVTTCPVPDGFPTWTLSPNDRQSPGKKFGVVRDLLNPWAKEVIVEFPEITICDQWQYVYEHRDGRYKVWWLGNDIHFSEGPAYAIGRLLALHVLERIGEYRPPGFVKSPAGNDGSVVPNNERYEPPTYSETKIGDFYSESATLAAMPEKWKQSTRLNAGFPKDFHVVLVARIPDEQGWEYQLDELPNHLRLKAIKEERQKGFGLAYYDFEEGSLGQSEFPSLRTRFGPGVTGDEFLNDVESETLNGRFVNSSFEFAYRNVAQYYNLYRVTRDRYYSEQIVRYANAIELLRGNDSNKTQQNSYSELVWPEVNAARLLLEEVRVDRAGPDDKRVATAKGMVATSMQLLNLSLANEYQSPFRFGLQQELSQFVPGRNTLWLVDKRRVPKRAAQLIEYRSWRESMRFLATLTTCVCALEELQGIEGSGEFVEEIAIYRRVIAAGLELFQRENDSVVLDRIPFFFHASRPMQDQPRTARLGHPLFKGESLVDAVRIANDLNYIWEANESFGCSTGLVSGYANSIANQLRNPTSNLQGVTYPRERLDSPWFMAATGEPAEPANQFTADVLFLAPFAPDILQAHRQWTSHRQTDEEIQLLRAVAIYGERKRRHDRKMR